LQFEYKKPCSLQHHRLICQHRREARKLNRVADVRLAALRDNNYEEYVRLAQQAKDGRLHELLEKTDAIIAELGTKVRTLACLFVVQLNSTKYLLPIQYP